MFASGAAFATDLQGQGGRYFWSGDWYLKIGATGFQFVLAFTVGLLAFLLIDTLSEGLEAGAAALGRLRAQSLVWAAALVAFLTLLAVGRRDGQAPEGLSLAFFIALGIGLHNLGEGLAVGGSLAAGEASLAAFLVIGFALHNLSEGVAIVGRNGSGKTTQLALLESDLLQQGYSLYRTACPTITSRYRL